MATQKETLRLLCKSIISRMENQKSISFPARLRQIVQDEVFGLISPYVFTDEDLREKVLAKMGAKADMLQETTFTESEQYRAAKAVIRNNFGSDEMSGFYFQCPPKEVANSIVQYLMRSSHIDDVYETDEDLEHMIIDVVKKFNVANLH